VIGVPGKVVSKKLKNSLHFAFSLCHNKKFCAHRNFAAAFPADARQRVDSLQISNNSFAYSSRVVFSAERQTLTQAERANLEIGEKVLPSQKCVEMAISAQILSPLHL